MKNFPINLLKTTQTVIRKQSYSLEEWSGRAKNARLIEVDTYDEAVTRKASVQPVSSKELQISGLDMTQAYIKIYDVDLINILTRSSNPPRITYDGYYYTPIPQNDDWSTQGGWNKVYCSKQGVAS